MTQLTTPDVLITLMIIGCIAYIFHRVGYSKGWKDCIRQNFQPEEDEDEE